MIGALGARISAGAVLPGLPQHLPSLILVPALVAGAVVEPVRMELRVLVERDGVGRVLVAEDPSAATAVVTSFKEVERLHASRVVTSRAFFVALCV